MKVLMVTPSYYPIKGGAETIIHDLSIKLKCNGVNVDILTFNMDQKWRPLWHGKTEQKNGIAIYKVPALNWFPLTHSDRITMGVNLIPGRFRKILKKYDVLHFHGGDLTLPLFSYGVKKPKIFHLHGLSSEFFRRYFISRLILKNIAHVYICPTKIMRNELISLGIPQEKIDVLPNGININQFYPLGEKEENLVLFVGRVCREKGIFTLLKAISSLKTSVKLAIIGPQNCDQQQFDNMLELIKKENEKGKHRITYLGAKNREEIIEWYRKASLLVLPSQREGLPMVILESLACETPVVATSVGGIPEIFSHNECGILVPPNSPLKLAEAIQFLLDNKDIRTKFGKKGRIMVIEKYSMDKVVEKLCKIYNEAISNFYS